MRIQAKHMLAVPVAVLILTVATGLASASRLSFGSRTIRAVYPMFNIQEEGIGIELECPLTLEGSFHASVVTKVVGNLIGQISRAITSAAACQRGFGYMLNGAEVLGGTPVINTLPWHIRYRGFTGTLPNITGVQVGIVGFKMLVIYGPPFNFACLIQSTAAKPLVATFVREEIFATDLRFDETVAIEKLSGGGACPNPPYLVGTGEVTQLGNTNVLTLVLI